MDYAGKYIRIKVNSSEEFIEDLYTIIKNANSNGDLTVEGLNALSELVTELANRKKEEQGGEQEG